MRKTSDMENLMTAMIPGGIEASEAAGQRQLCEARELPKKMGGISRAQLEEAWGVKFLGDADDIFFSVRLPKGWKLIPTDHSMWNELRDDKGRKRASIFYKAAFYDRSSHMRVEPRFYGDFQDGGPNRTCRQIIKDRLEFPEKELYTTAWGTYSEAAKESEDWLKANYPNHINSLEYWK